MGGRARQCRWARGIRRERGRRGESERNRGGERETGVALRLVHARTPTSGTHVTRPDRYALPKSPSLSVYLSPSFPLPSPLPCLPLCSLSFLSLFRFSYPPYSPYGSSSPFHAFSLSTSSIISPSNAFLLLSCCAQTVGLSLSYYSRYSTFFFCNFAHSSHVYEQSFTFPDDRCHL